MTAIKTNNSGLSRLRSNLNSPQDYMIYSSDLEFYKSFLSVRSNEMIQTQNSYTLDESLIIRVDKLNIPNDLQKSIARSIANKLSHHDYSLKISDLEVELSEDNEVVFIRHSDFGRHYLIIGDEGSNDLTYGFVGLEPGIYSYNHIDDTIPGIENMVLKFVYA